MFLAVLAVVPGLTLRLGGVHPEPLPRGVARSGSPSSAPRSCWRGAPRSIQLDISAGLALALLALIAVLPEYAVDFVFTWKAGKDPTYAPDALANMTGGNQLLIGVGWSMVVLVAAYRIRAARKGEGPQPLPPSAGSDHHRRRARTHALGRDRVPRARDAVRPHAAASSRSLMLFDSAVLVTIFVVYIVRVARAPGRGAASRRARAARSARSRPRNRRIVVGLLFVGCGRRDPRCRPNRSRSRSSTRASSSTSTTSCSSSSSRRSRRRRRSSSSRACSRGG